MNQLSFFTELWKQLLECFFVFYKTLKRDNTVKIRRLDHRIWPLVAKQSEIRTYSICGADLSLLQGCAIIERL